MADCEEDEDICDDGQYQYDEEDEKYDYDEDEKYDYDDDSFADYAASAKETISFPFILANLPNREDSVRLSIFQLLHDIMCKIKSTDLEWNLDNNEIFYAPTLHFISTYAESYSHSLRLKFNRTNFVDKPFQIQPTRSMHPVAFFSVLFHPFVTPTQWNPFRNWVEAFDNMFDTLKAFESTDPIVGGTWSFDESYSVQLSLSRNRSLERVVVPSVADYLDSIALEILFYHWYKRCFEEIPFTVWCDGNLFDLPSQSDIVRITKLKAEYVPFKGVGYRESHALDKVKVVNPILSLVEAIERRLTLHSRNLQMIRWICASPVLTIVLYSLREFDGNFLDSAAKEWVSLFLILAHFEEWAVEFPQFVTIPRKDFETLYESMVEGLAIDLQEDSVSEDIATIFVRSPLCAQKRAALLTKIREESQVGKISTTAISSAEIEEVRWIADQRVYLDVPAMHRSHHFMIRDNGNTSSSSQDVAASPSGVLSARSKAHIMRELRFLRKDLIPQITLFVSEESLQYMMFTIVINETPDNPYYGGIFCFHMKLPGNYPDRAPEVIFVTTGSGQVRFNPNLYNCGKVCLSLLGTWQGPSWDPEKSSLNQLLTSIYFLIFTEEPFFNEPGYEERREKFQVQSDLYSLQVRQNVLSAANYFHFAHPCPVLKQWIWDFVRERHWPRHRDWFYAMQDRYEFDTVYLEKIDQLLGAANFTGGDVKAVIEEGRVTNEMNIVFEDASNVTKDV